MEFIVPQFIEKEAKIFGPFTFTQFIFIGIAGGILIFLYFLLPFPIFLIVTAILLGGAFALAFLKIEGIPLPTVIQNSFTFLFRPKIYLWQKKTTFPKITEKKDKPKKLKEEEEEEEEEKKEEKLPLQIAEKSRLKELSNYLETRTK